MTDVDRVLANIATFGLRLLRMGKDDAAFAIGCALIGNQHEYATCAGRALVAAASRMPREWKR